MKWNDLANGFCEGIVSGPPEYVSSVTSIAMLFYGLMGLFVTRNHNVLIRITSAMLAVTGVGSFMYHWTWYQGWGQLDGIPMMIASYLGLFQIMDLLFYKKISLDDNNKRKYELISGANALMLMSMMLISLSLSVTDDTSHLFTILFALPEVMMALCIVATKCTIQTRDKSLPIEKEILTAYRVGYRGILTAVVAAVIWVLSENLCPYNPWLRYTYMHGIWHIAISAGMYNIMQFMVFLYSYYKNLDPYFVTSNTWYGKLFYTLVPAIDV